MTEMERVGLWNTTAGKPCGCSDGKDEVMRSQILMLAEEITGSGELYASYKRDLEHSLLDGCGDVLVVATGVLHLLGHSKFVRLPEPKSVDIDLDEVIDELFFLGQGLQENPLQLEPVAVANACIQYVIDILHYKGYDPEEILGIVNDSNFSKFCKDKREAEVSRNAYTKSSNQAKRYSNVKYRKVGKYWVMIGDDKLHGAKNKTLKSIYFSEPDFVPVIRKVNPQRLEGFVNE